MMKRVQRQTKRRALNPNSATLVFLWGVVNSPIQNSSEESGGMLSNLVDHHDSEAICLNRAARNRLDGREMLGRVRSYNRKWWRVSEDIRDL